MSLPFVGTIVTGQRFRRNLLSRSDPPWAHVWFLAFNAASMLVSFAWFGDPVHDIALLFGSHGRWDVRSSTRPGHRLCCETRFAVLALSLLGARAWE
jgi:hypothetical protein